MTMVAEAKARSQTSEPRSPNLFAAAIRSELSALAEIEARYEQMRSGLEGWTGSEIEKQSLLAQIDECHRRDRAPHVLCLADLHQRRTLLDLFPSMRAGQ